MRRHGWDAKRRRGDGSGASEDDFEAVPVLPSPGDSDPGVASVADPAPPDAEIPELRKKEKERKGAGVFWTGGAPGSGSLLARAATGGGFSSPLGLGRLAAAMARRVGAQTAFGRLLLGRAGGWLLLGGILSGGVVAGIFAGVLARRPSQPLAAAPSLALEGPKTNIVVNGPRDRSLSYLQNANEGELSFEEKKAQASKETEASDGAVEAEATADTLPLGALGEPPVNADAIADAVGAAARTDMAQFGKLSDMRGAFGKNGSFGGGGFGAPGGLGNRDLLAKLPPKDARFGKSSTFGKGRPKMQAKNMMRIGGRASKAMGQLKMSRFMSGKALTQGKEEASSQFASNAFEQSKTQGGELPAFIGPTNGAPQVVIPPGSGAPDVTSLPTPPPVGPPVNATPYQGNLDALKGMGDMAGQMKMMSIMMIIAGLALIVAGYGMGLPWGIALVVAGIALIASGFMMAASAANMAAQAKKMADSIVAQQYEQTEQAKIAADTAKAKAENKPYTPPNLSEKTKRNDDVKKAVEGERNATYEFDDGTGSNQ